MLAVILATSRRHWFKMMCYSFWGAVILGNVGAFIVHDVPIWERWLIMLAGFVCGYVQFLHGMIDHETISGRQTNHHR